MHQKLKIIVTGGSGFIGQKITKRYVELGHQVFVIDKKIHPSTHPLFVHQVEYIECNLTEKEKLKKIVDVIKPTVINHHAAAVDVKQSILTPSEDAKNNVIGTLHLLEAIRNSPVEKFIFASSGGAIYDSAGTPPFPEDQQVQPNSPYGISKLSCEQYIQFFSAHFNSQTIIFRYANVYGSTQIYSPSQGVVVRFIQNMISNKPLTIDGDGTQRRDFIFVDDVVAVNEAALNSKYLSNIYNIGTGISHSVLDVVDILQAQLNKKIQLQHSSEFVGVYESRLSVQKVRNQRMIKQITPLKTGLQQVIRELQNH